MTNPCFILGNGPSLRGFDFKGLGETASLGMNAAYRYWDEINWYPTYFACLDDQLIISHHDEIYRLFKEGNIKAFFLHGTFFDHHPDCICDPAFTSLDQVLPHWYKNRGAAQGWPSLMDHPAFWTEDTTKVTTGAWATRFAAFMGHDLLALAGIDLQYVEVLPEAKQGDGIKLEMAETPKENPNYFFDSYQRKGDKFNVPNPAAHDGKLHIDSFALVRRDFAIANPGVTVVNTNPVSQLEIDKIFPLRTVAEVLAQPVLEAVVVPATSFEIAAILANFDIWADPAHAPLAEGQHAGLTALHFVFNNRSAEGYEALIRETFQATGMDRYFVALRFTYLNLTGTADAYTRDYSQKVGDEGYKSGPNNQFFGMIAAMAGSKAPVFQMETDCVPLRAGWLTAVRDVVAKASPFWVLGARYTGVETLSPDFVNHLNGNAIYAVNDPEFQDFVRDFWAPRTRAMVAGTDKRLAYDCILETIFTRLKDEPEVKAALAAHRTKFRAHETLLNVSGKRDLEELAPDYETALLETHPAAFILHNRAAQERVADALAKPRRIPKPGQVMRPALETPRAPVTPPRLLIIDMTAMGNGSATGEIKANLLRAFPRDHLLQVASPNADTLALVRAETRGFAVTPADEATIRAAIADFAPEMILYRVLPDRPGLHALAMDLIETLDLPLVTWIMDDWPARLYATDRETFDRIDTDLRSLLKRSVLRLSICRAMSEAYAERYDLEFVPFANGVDPNVWANPRQHSPGPVVVRYAGGLAPDMNAESVQRIAKVIQQLADEGRDIRFEINTQSWWMDHAKGLFKGMDVVSITAEKRNFTAYRDWLCSADILVIAYNFDPVSTRYVRYSMANKMPECLASGAAVLAHGPGQIATIDYLARHNVARVVSEESQAALKSALVSLAQPGARQTVASRARKRAMAAHNLGVLADDLLRTLDDARKDSARPALRLYLAEGAQATGVKMSDRAARDQAAATFTQGRRGLMIYDDPVTALAASLTPQADPAQVMANWLSTTVEGLALYRAHRNQVTLVMRTPLAAFTDQDLRDLTRATGLARPPEPLATPLRMPDPVLMALAQHLITATPEAAPLIAELAAGRHPWGGATDMPPPDLGVALAHWHATLAEAKAPRAATAGSLMLDQAQARIAAQAAEIKRITSSRSWRLTGKLRGLRARLGGLRRRLR